MFRARDSAGRVQGRPDEKAAMHVCRNAVKRVDEAWQVTFIRPKIAQTGELGFEVTTKKAGFEPVLIFCILGL